MEFSRVQKSDAQVERLKSNMRLKEKTQDRPAPVNSAPQLTVCVLLNGSMVDAAASTPVWDLRMEMLLPAGCIEPRDLQSLTG